MQLIPQRAYCERTHCSKLRFERQKSNDQEPHAHHSGAHNGASVALFLVGSIMSIASRTSRYRKSFGDLGTVNQGDSIPGWMDCDITAHRGSPFGAEWAPEKHRMCSSFILRPFAAGRAVRRQCKHDLGVNLCEVLSTGASLIAHRWNVQGCRCICWDGLSSHTNATCRGQIWLLTWARRIRPRWNSTAVNSYVYLRTK